MLLIVRCRRKCPRRFSVVYDDVTSQGSYTVTVGAYSSSGTFANPTSGTITKVQAYNAAGSVIVDYIVTSGTAAATGTSGTTTGGKQYSWTALADTCEGADRDFAVTPVGVAGMSYEKMASICSSDLQKVRNCVPGTALCSVCYMEDLRNVLKYNRACYKDAVNYCVGVVAKNPNAGLYINTQEGTDVFSGADGVGSVSGGTDAVTVCSSALMLSQVSETMVYPILNVITNQLKVHWLMVMMAFAIIIVLVFIALPRR
jgi:hypothetical protein